MRNKVIDNKLIEEYTKGTLPLVERFNLEKDALDDDFLFEALEGYSYAENSELKKVQIIFASVIKQKNEAAVIRKLVPYRWIGGIAATILLLSAVTYVYKNSPGDSLESESISILANAIEPVLDDEQEPVSKVKDVAMLSEGEKQESKPIADPPIDKNSAKTTKQTSIKTPKLELKTQPVSNQKALAANEDPGVQKLSDGINDAKNSEEIASPTFKAPSIGKNSLLKSTKVKGSIAMELNKEVASIIKEEVLNEAATTALAGFLEKEIKKISSNNIPIKDTNMNMFLDLSEDSLIKEAVFISGCKTCFDAIYKSLVGKRIDNVDASQVGKKLIFRFKSK